MKTIIEEVVNTEATIEYKAEFIEGFSVCGICGKASDGTVIRKSEAEFLRDNPQIQKTCETCSSAIKNGVTMICKGVNCFSKEPCNNIIVFDTKKVSQSLGEEIEDGSSFEAFGCPACSPDKKIHLTKESLELAYKNYKGK